jgi:hypothetical protein
MFKLISTLSALVLLAESATKIKQENNVYHLHKVIITHMSVICQSHSQQ